MNNFTPTKANFLEGSEYNFLREDKRLGENIAYLTVAGSIAYGTNNENSDVDIRGFAVESVDSLLTGKAFEQVENKATDTVVYSLRKFFHLCASGNPNVIELLGTNPEHILHLNTVGKKVRDNSEIFLSKRVFKTFAGYATSQLRRLQNALAHDSYTEREKNQHILKSIEHMMMSTRATYELSDADIIFKMQSEEIVVTVDVKDLPLRKFLAVNSNLTTMLCNYDKLNHRNNKKDKEHLNKHAMHLVRLYLMGIDILEGRGVITYREKDLHQLRKIRSGEIPLDNVFAMVSEHEEKLKSAYKNSKLPDNPDLNKIDQLLIEIYRESVITAVFSERMIDNVEKKKARAACYFFKYPAQRKKDGSETSFEECRKHGAPKNSCSKMAFPFAWSTARYRRKRKKRRKTAILSLPDFLAECRKNMSASFRAKKTTTQKLNVLKKFATCASNILI